MRHFINAVLLQFQQLFWHYVFSGLFLDLKLHLQSTDYGNFLANEAGPLTVSLIDEKLKEKLVIEFTHVRNQALPPLSTFLDFLTYVTVVFDTYLLIMIITYYGDTMICTSKY